MRVGRARVLWWVGWLAACSPKVEPPPPPPSPPSDAELLARRPYKEHAPASAPDAGAALVVVLAGYGGTAADTADAFGLTAYSDAAGVYLALPNGTRDATGTLAWHPGTAHAPSWDVEYLRAVIRDMEARHGVDPARVYVAGHSQGAHMVHRMGCDDADDVVGLLSVAGQAPLAPAACRPSRPVTALLVHGTADAVIGYDGDVQNSPPDPSVPSAHQSAAVWARNDACDGGIVATGQTFDFVPSLPGDETFVEAYGGCAQGTAVELWTVDGGTHAPDFDSAFAPAAVGFLEAHRR